MNKHLFWTLDQNIHSIITKSKVSFLIFFQTHLFDEDRVADDASEYWAKLLEEVEVAIPCLLWDTDLEWIKCNRFHNGLKKCIIIVQYMASLLNNAPNYR